MKRIDRPAFEMGYDYGWFNQTMLTWREYTQGSPGYNYSWGSYKRGYAKGQEDRQSRERGERTRPRDYRRGEKQ